MTEQTSAIRRPSLLVSGVANWLPMAVNLVTSLILVPFVIRYLGKEDYGIWALATSFLGYYGLLRMGVDTSIMRFLPFYVGKQDRPAAAQVVSTAMGMFSFVGLVILLVSAVVAGPIARFYGGGHSLALLVLLTGMATAMECPYRVLDATLRAEERWGSANLVGVVTTLLRAGVTMGCLWLGYRLIGMGYATIVVTLVTLILAAVVFRKVSSGIRLGLSMFSWAHLPEMLSYGALTSVTTLAYSLVLPGHRLIIGKLVSLEAVAVYTVAATLIERLRQAVWSPFQVSWPRFALLHGEQDHEGLSRLFERGTRYCSQLSSFLVLVTVLFGPPFIRLWVGSGFEEAERILVILCLGVLVESSAFMGGSFLGGTGRQRAQSVFAVAEGALGLGLSLGLGWHSGMTGVAWGYTISVIVVRGMALTFYVCRLLRLNPVRYLYQAFMGPWFFTGAVVCLGYALHLPARIHSWYSLTAVSTLGLAAIAAGMYVFVMTAEEREKAMYWIRRLCPRTA
jgi:O-antigen/teichoic acid export membrane protein